MDQCDLSDAHVEDVSFIKVSAACGCRPVWRWLLDLLHCPPPDPLVPAAAAAHTNTPPPITSTITNDHMATPHTPQHHRDPCMTASTTLHTDRGVCRRRCGV